MAKTAYFSGTIGGVPAEGYLRESDDREEMMLEEYREAHPTCGPVCTTLKVAAGVAVGVALLAWLTSKSE